jgi:hypothetical protein
MLFSSVTGLPSTTSAISVSTDFVRQLRRYYTDVRLLARRSCTDCAFGFPCRSGGWLAPDAGEASLRPPLRGPVRSVLARAVSRRAHGSRTTPGLTAGRVIVPISVAFPLQAHGRRPNCVFRSSIPGPVDASVYASPGTSRHPAQDSRSRWFATPFLWGSFIPDCTPVYPDDCTR